MPKSDFILVTCSIWEGNLCTDQTTVDVPWRKMVIWSRSGCWYRMCASLTKRTWFSVLIPHFCLQAARLSCSFPTAITSSTEAPLFGRIWSVLGAWNLISNWRMTSRVRFPYHDDEGFCQKKWYYLPSLNTKDVDFTRIPRLPSETITYILCPPDIRASHNLPHGKKRARSGPAWIKLTSHNLSPARDHWGLREDYFDSLSPPSSGFWKFCSGCLCLHIHTTWGWCSYAHGYSSV